MFNAIIDFIFPPSPEEVRIRSLSPVDFLAISPKAGVTEFPFITSVFSYKDPLVRELVWQIKYKKNKHAVEIAGYALYETFKNITGNILLIPIPLSKKRRRERGYNQCELIIDEIVRLDNRFVRDYEILKRVIHKDRQTDKNREERIQNSENIFDAIKKCDAQIKIIIIDDVTTTGSTLREARTALLNAGYNNVEALTVAH
jgi:competence protein ComFC